MTTSPGDVLKLTEHPDFERSVPTPDHFIPYVYIAALAAVGDDTPAVLVDGYAYGSLSMACYTLGSDCAHGNSQDPAATIPPPEDVPIDQSNL